MGSNDKLKEISIKYRMCHCFNDAIKIEDFDIDNILMDEKSYENILVYNVLSKRLIDANPLHIRSDEIDRFTRVYDGTIYLVKNMIPFTTGLDIF